MTEKHDRPAHVVGSEVTVVNEIAGNLIVQVKQSRLALDKTMASRIMVD